MIKKLPKNNMRFSAVVMICLSALFFAACKKDAPAPAAPPPPPAKVVAPVKPVQKQASSASRLPPPSVNQFDFSNKKDPFKPFIAVKVEPAKVSLETRKRMQRGALPIHSFDVSQFKLIGIITGARENKAMVTDPNGKGYVLKEGMLIGKNDGRIVLINAAGVDVVEQFRDDNGRVRKENIKLTLPRKQ